MNKLNRREFLRTSIFTGAALASHGPFNAAARVLGANDEIHYAVVGFGGRGQDHLKEMRDVQGARLVALCEVDSTTLDREMQKCETRGEKVQAYRDIRLLLEKPDVDAVTLATPNHLH